MKNNGLAEWHLSAAYLYTLTLDSVGLAWEYLRRNAAYRTAWSSHSESSSASSAEWGLRSWEDPDRDARAAVPIWWPAPTSSVQLMPASTGRSDSNFHLWRILGHKTLMHDGTDLHLTATHYPKTTRAILDPGIVADQPYAYLIPAGNSARASCRAVHEFDDRYRHSVRAKLVPRPPGVVPIQILQAIDGADAGASHRDLAVALLGYNSVKEHWSPDGDMRARIRYLLKRGRALSNGGYRALLNAD